RAGPQHVEAHPRDDRGQPAAQVLDRAGVGARELEPRLLHGVVGLGRRAEHAVRDQPQMAAVLLEGGGELAHGFVLSVRGAGSVARHPSATSVSTSGTTTGRAPPPCAGCGAAAPVRSNTAPAYAPSLSRGRPGESRTSPPATFHTPRMTSRYAG